MKRRNRGITLVALVVTIIILLILAGITLNLTLGQNGIITRAQQAGRNYMDAEEEEQRKLEDFLNQADNMIKGTNGSISNEESSDEDKEKIAELERKVDELQETVDTLNKQLEGPLKIDNVEFSNVYLSAINSSVVNSKSWNYDAPHDGVILCRTLWWRK